MNTLSIFKLEQTALEALFQVLKFNAACYQTAAVQIIDRNNPVKIELSNKYIATCKVILKLWDFLDHDSKIRLENQQQEEARLARAYRLAHKIIHDTETITVQLEGPVFEIMQNLIGQTNSSRLRTVLQQSVEQMDSSLINFIQQDSSEAA